MSSRRSGWERTRTVATGADTDGGFGRAIAGRGYYVWDEDAREAALWARELGASRASEVSSTGSEESEGGAGLD